MAMSAAENVGDSVARNCLRKTSFTHMARMATDSRSREWRGGLRTTLIADAATSCRKELRHDWLPSDSSHHFFVNIEA